MLSMIQDFWPHILGTSAILIAVALSIKVILERRDERATITWVGLLWLSPFAGAAIYFLLGTNRIRRRAIRLRPGDRQMAPLAIEGSSGSSDLTHLTEKVGHLAPLSRVVSELTHKGLTSGNQIALLPGNRIDALTDGDMAYGEMIEAIDEAKQSIMLASYIFNRDAAGQMFIDALFRAKKRGVKIRVLVDGIGSLYSPRSTVGYLHRHGIKAQKFLHSLLPWRMPYLNMRNHQKIMVVDGKIGFTGGMNIRKEYLSSQSATPIKDLHFKIQGPVVRHLSKTFSREWYFTTQEILEDLWMPPLAEAGPVMARGIWSGPDEPIDKARWTILGAISAAQESITVVTPYFLPDQTIHTALRLAALRGLNVNILLPEENNLAYVKWASMGLLEELILAGCRITMTAPPFDHSKLMLVDDRWVLLGSANWDPRSLRLNFEFNVECYDEDLAKTLGVLVTQRLQGGRILTAEELSKRPWLIKLRDGVVRLLTPYL
ncbi:MAG: cardiolipin synthase [Pseudomonadota bacterium]